MWGVIRGSSSVPERWKVRRSDVAEISGLQHWLRPYATALLGLAAQRGVYVEVTSVRRSYASQARLYRNFLRGRSRYPAAPPGRSAHEHGRAFDLNASPQALACLGGVWEQARRARVGGWCGRGND